ncbi:hypothetical protein QYU52_004234 [Salmonella enterica]|nr:hypothetical protein [Salmonella enterica]
MHTTEFVRGGAAIRVAEDGQRGVPYHDVRGGDGRYYVGSVEPVEVEEHVL